MVVLLVIACSDSVNGPSRWRQQAAPKVLSARLFGDRGDWHLRTVLAGVLPPTGTLRVRLERSRRAATVLGASVQGPHRDRTGAARWAQHVVVVSDGIGVRPSIQKRRLVLL